MSTPVDLRSPLADRATTAPLLEVSDLSVAFPKATGSPQVVRSAGFSVARNQVVGLVGESGSGKSVTAMTVLGLLSSLGGEVTAGSIEFEGRQLVDLDERGWADLRGRDISMVFQQPTRTLNPAFTVGEQIAEVVRRHHGASRKQAWAEAVEMLDRVHIPNAASRARQYPHQFSGGMAQRAAIAMALVCRPKLLIADEPTTALDVTVQRHILDLLLEMQDETGIGILFVTHDMGVIAEMADEVAVMYAGEVVEQAPVLDLFTNPQHPYTEGLLGSIPSRSRSRSFQGIPGSMPPVSAMPDGCRFAPRCAYAQPECRGPGPMPMFELEGRRTRCRRYDELVLTGIGS